MDAFESLGEFWIAGSDRRVPGKFRYDPESRSELELIGHLDDGDIDGPFQRPLIQGKLLTASPGVGRCITMVRGLRVRSTFGGELRSEAWVADRVYAADSWLDTAAQGLLAAQLEVSELLPWMGLSGLTPSGTHEAKYESPPSIRFGLPDASLTVEAGAHVTHGRHAFSIVERGRIVVQPDTPAEASECERRWISPLLWFLAACLGRAPTVARTEHVIGERERLLLLVEGNGTVAGDFNPFDALVRPAAEELGTLLARFFEIAALRDAFMRLYFPSVQYPPRYIEPRLLVLLEALSLWAGDRESGLRWLAGAPATTCCLPEDVDPAQWVSELKTWTVRGSVGRVAFVHSERLRWALHVALLEELGCSLDELRQDRRLRWLRTLAVD